MHHMKLKAALDKFKDVTVKEQITGDYTPEEIDTIWAALTTPSVGGTSKEAQHTGDAQHDLENELAEQRAENERLKKQLETGNQAPEKPKEPATSGAGRNSILKLTAIKGKRFEGPEFEAYLETVRNLDQRTLYDWTEYNAVGIWKQTENADGDMVDTNVLVGIELVNSNPLKHTAMQPSHIEYWMTGQRGRKVMGGMNAQIYDKSNNRANSRFYLLRGVVAES